MAVRFVEKVSKHKEIAGRKKFGKRQLSFNGEIHSEKCTQYFVGVGKEVTIMGIYLNPKNKLRLRFGGAVQRTKNRK